MINIARWSNAKAAKEGRLKISFHEVDGQKRLVSWNSFV